MKQLYKLSIVLMILTVLGLSSVEQLYAQNISNRTFAPDSISIVGGEKADPGEYPWQVALMEFGEQVCGGTLIAPDWVLTAAHCVEYGADQVMLGAHRLNKDEESRQLIDVSQVIIHPQYDSYMIDSDIALLKLAEPATLNDRVQTIGLLQSQAVAGTLSTIIGWGTTSEMGNPSNVLREVSVPIVSQAMCTRVYGDEVTENMICAGLAKGGKDSCYGDSGGPLVVSDGGDGWLQAGIVSWGEGCALKGSYGVYTNLPLFVDWVQGYLDGTTVDEEVVQGTNGADQEWYETAAQAIGIDVDTLQSEIDGGLSIAEVASANEVDLQTVIDAMQAAEEISIQQLLADGSITQQEADEWLEVLPELLDTFVNETVYGDWGDWGDWDDWDDWDELYPDDIWPDEPMDVEYIDWDEVAAQTIGIDLDTFYELYWDQGQSIAEIATANEIELQSVISAVVVAESGYIQQLVDAEYITQEEADEWTATLSDDVASYVNDPLYTDDFLDIPFIDWDEVAIQTIGIDSEIFYELNWDQGQSIAEIAVTYEVEPQSVISAVITAESELAQELLQSEYLTQEEADEWITTLSNDVAYFVHTIYIDWDAVAAETIGIDLETFYELWWEKGQSIAEIATENGVESQSVIDAILAAENDALQRMIANGYEMTQEEADDWIVSLSEEVAYFIDDTFIIDDWWDYSEDEWTDTYPDDEADDSQADDDADDEAEDESEDQNDSQDGDDDADDESEDESTDETSDETDGDSEGDEVADEDESDDDTMTDENDSQDDVSDETSDEADGDSEDDEVADEDESDDDTMTDENDSQDDVSDDTMTDENDSQDGDSTDETADETKPDSEETDGASQDSDVSDEDESDDTMIDENSSQDDDTTDETSDETSDETNDSDETDGDSQDSDSQGDEVADEDQGAADVPAEPASEEVGELGSLGADNNLPVDGTDEENGAGGDTATEEDVQKDIAEDAEEKAKMLWVDWFEVAAKALNMEVDPFFDALDEGHSIAEIAADNGTESQAIIDAIISAEQAMIEKNVADGLFPQEKADEWLAELPEVAAHFVEDAAGCTDIDMIDGVDWFAVAVQSIGVDKEQFWITVDLGQNIAAIAADNGTESQTVIDAIVSAETAQAEQQVADGVITQADADEWLADLDTFVAEFVDMKFADGESKESDKEVDGSNEEGQATDQSMPTATVAAADMTLDLYKNARTKTPAAFSADDGSRVYLPMVMK